MFHTIVFFLLIQAVHALPKPPPKPKPTSVPIDSAPRNGTEVQLLANSVLDASSYDPWFGSAMSASSDWVAIQGSSVIALFAHDEGDSWIKFGQVQSPLNLRSPTLASLDHHLAYTMWDESNFPLLVLISITSSHNIHDVAYSTSVQLNSLLPISTVTESTNNVFIQEILFVQLSGSGNTLVLTMGWDNNGVFSLWSGYTIVSDKENTLYVLSHIHTHKAPAQNLLSRYT
jgi:hypothetical protein